MADEGVMDTVMPQIGSFQAAWYLLQCKPRQNFRAEENLNNQGYTCYHPVQEVERIQRGKKVRVREPLFPGYMFIQLDKLADNWRPVRSTRGVNRLVAFNEQPLPVALSIIDGLRARTERVIEQTPFSAGDTIRITRGAFAELEAIFQSFDGDKRVVLLFELLHQPYRLVLPLADISKP